MATITLEYNKRNSMANKIIDIIIAMDNVFKIKNQEKTKHSHLTRKAIQDAENGNIIVCSSYDEYIKHTSQYA